MLVLSRREGETLHIGDDVVVTILKIRGSSKVSLAVDAPDNTTILRGELVETENQAAADQG